MPTRPRLERDYTIPDDCNDSDDPRLQHYYSRQARRHKPSSKGRAASYDQAQEEEVDIPEYFSNLDELPAASPVELCTNALQDVLEDRLPQADNARRVQAWRRDLDALYAESAAQPPRTVHPLSAASKATVPYNPPVTVNKYGSGSPAPRARVSRTATELYTISHLVLFSIFGTLARLGLQALTFYPGAPIQTGLLWANFAGSLFLGFLSEDQRLFQEHITYSSSGSTIQGLEEKGDLNSSDPELLPYIVAAQRQAASKKHAGVKRTIPVYIGLATGFCGSLTSFSSFMRDAFLALSNRLSVPVSHTSSSPIAPNSTVPRNGGYSFMAICAVIIVTVLLCLGGLQAGAHLAIALEPLMPGIPEVFARRVVDRVVVLVAWTAWLGAVFMTVWPPDRPGGPIGRMSWAQELWRGDALFAIVFAPPGCLLRFYASLHLNGTIRSFPVGTFAVNILGTAMEGMFYDLQHVPLGGRVGCQVLQGLMDGFCGCLTTVSTWVVELKGLRIRHAYVYGGVSVGVGVGLMTIIMGSLQWTVGFRAPLCGH